MNEIIEITIAYHAHAYEDETFDDAVKVDRYGVRYEYLPLHESDTDPVRRWSYTTNSPVFGVYFRDLKKEMPAALASGADVYGGSLWAELTVRYEGGAAVTKKYPDTADIPGRVISIARAILPPCEYPPAALMTDDSWDSDVLDGFVI